MGKKVFLNEFSALEVKQLLEHRQDVVAIVPFGSCESHGWHCPLGPDYFVPTEVARRVAERLEDVIVVPCLPYGTSIHYNRFPLSLTLRFETVQAVAEDVLESLIADLHSRGHHSLTIRENGEIAIQQADSEITRPAFENVPEKTYWPRLVKVFEREGMAADITENGMVLSW